MLSELDLSEKMERSSISYCLQELKLDNEFVAAFTTSLESKTH